MFYFSLINVESRKNDKKFSIKMSHRDNAKQKSWINIKI